MPETQQNNPLHGVTLKEILTELVDYYGWAELDHQIPIRCFAFEPSIKSSLTFLRRTPCNRRKSVRRNPASSQIARQWFPYRTSCYRLLGESCLFSCLPFWRMLFFLG
jgi:16S rRNA A1518/A1519 N6-dimethyltransferase RsmA/KsgA/DIM1 with predicted DNA glycosylase/AP lyase activity